MKLFCHDSRAHEFVSKQRRFGDVGVEKYNDIAFFDVSLALPLIRFGEELFAFFFSSLFLFVAKDGDLGGRKPLGRLQQRKWAVILAEHEFIR